VHPLVIDAEPSDIRVLHSGLELKNRSIADAGIAHNRRLREQRKAESHKVLRHEAEAGAEFIHKRSSTTKTVRLTDVEQHYNLT
jgi:hypothetical protein